MFYKYNQETNEWYTGLEIHFPHGIILSVNNKIAHDGWEWHDTPPQEYIQWEISQSNIT